MQFFRGGGAKKKNNAPPHGTLFGIMRDILIFADFFRKLELPKTKLYHNRALRSVFFILILCNAPLVKRPIPKNVMHKRYVISAHDNRSASSFNGKFFELLGIEFFRRLVFPGLAKFPVNSPQNAVHEFAGILPAKCLGEFDSFVNRNLRRNIFVITEKKFPESDPQNVAVNNRNFFEWPLGRGMLYDFVEFCFFLNDALRKSQRKVFAFKPRPKFIHNPVEDSNNLIRLCIAVEIPLVESLHRE